MSCSIPKTFVNNSNSLKDAVVLLGNLFSYSVDNDVSWLKASPFNDTPNLYLNVWESYILDSYLVVGGLSVIITILLSFCHFSKLRKRLIDTLETLDASISDENNVFLYHFGNATEIIFEWYCLMLAVILSIVYYIGSNQYQCGRLTGHFSIVYFNSVHVLLQSLIVGIIGMINIVILYQLYKFEVKTSNAAKKCKTKYLQDAQEDNERSCLSTIWIILYLLTIFLNFLYIASHTLPSHNILNMQVKYDYIFGYSLSLVLAISNIYIVPQMVDTCNCRMSKHRTVIIAIFRSLISIIFPMIWSFIFLNECGHYWSLLWNECVNDASSFDYYDSFLELFSLDGNVTLQLSTHQSVCATNKLSDIDINKCFRAFLDFWVPLIAAKLIFVIVNPWIILYVKGKKWDQYWKLLICKMCCKCRTRIDRNGNNGQDKDLSVVINDRDYDIVNDIDRKQSMVRTILIDSQYGLIVTKVELSIVFGIIAPFVMAIAALSCMSNFYAHYIFFSKFPNMRAVDVQNMFPSLFIFISVLLEQFLILVFCYSFFQEYLITVLIVLFAISDFVYIGYHYRSKLL